MQLIDETIGLAVGGSNFLGMIKMGICLKPGFMLKNVYHSLYWISYLMVWLY